MKITIPVNDHANFSFDECLVFLSRSDKEALHEVAGKTLRKVIVVNNTPVLTTITDAPKKKGLQVETSADADPAAIKNYITHWLHLDADLNEFYTFAGKDAVLSPLIQQYKGLRLIGIPELFEALTWTITGQQINLSFAYTLKQRLIHAYGDAVTAGDKTYYVYPQPATIAALEPATLTGMQFSRSKADYIISIARAMAEERLTLAQLQSLDYTAAREYLISFKGIGNWSANYVLMKFSRYWQALPLEDAGLHNAFKQQLNLAVKPSLAEIKKYTQHWQQHAAYATFYLWRSLQ
ncbi:DNA-3-methyladenine glycosylase family protein [Chitinophaga sancti]|uniref:DNA-3-methyladenine glycosylase II n=1 Tax=Chitinophaga sancti TaxID=1004 RepID=A0A1K1M8S3_9BACT|nr:DNA-3-methyladenine glycosylase [Chitinophaga sancti]WQD64552.1 DNA-3-methyladenine glycosylase [Chitinophaga sancti]WQG89823.1 DNA-3-methyladenine glycosylase [Chitinophaga sancti]SFW19503.1 DNA-3-methyladenine glycosylase II [Chitinophaga sancti]